MSADTSSSAEIFSSELRDLLIPHCVVDSRTQSLLTIRFVGPDNVAQVELSSNETVVDRILEKLKRAYSGGWVSTGVGTILTPLTNNRKVDKSAVLAGTMDKEWTSFLGYTKLDKKSSFKQASFEAIAAGLGRSTRATFAAKALWDTINATVALGTLDAFFPKGAEPYKWNNILQNTPCFDLKRPESLGALNTTAFVNNINLQREAVLSITDTLFNKAIGTPNNRFTEALHPENFETAIANVAALEGSNTDNAQISASDASTTIGNVGSSDKSFFEKPAGMVTLAIGGIAIGFAVSKLTSK